MADRIKAFSTNQEVFTRAADQGVAVEATNQGVAATATLHPVGTAQTGDAVVALLAQEHIGVAVNITADQGVITLASVEINHRNSRQRAASLQNVVAITTGEDPKEFRQLGEGLCQPVTQQRASEGNPVSIPFIKVVVSIGAVAGNNESQLTSRIVIS